MPPQAAPESSGRQVQDQGPVHKPQCPGGLVGFVLLAEGCGRRRVSGELPAHGEMSEADLTGPSPHPADGIRAYVEFHPTMSISLFGQVHGPKRKAAEHPTGLSSSGPGAPSRTPHRPDPPPKSRGL